MNLHQKLKKFWYWVVDYWYLISTGIRMVFWQKQPKHYLGYVIENKKPIILIPGIFGKWHFLKAIADPLSVRGHPIYVLEHLRYQTDTIHNLAKIVRAFIEKHNLKNTIIIAHSKGGLIGHILAYDNQDGRIKKLIAIATPFGGSHIVRLVPIKKVYRMLEELLPGSEILEKLHKEGEINKHIVSIFGVFDNHVWPLESCRLEGAKNIQIETYGHHRILFDKKTRDVIFTEIEKM